MELIRLIGKGANSRVYLAKHRLLDSYVAVKILDLNQADAEQALKRFQNEAELLNSFNNKNIVKFLSFGKSPEGLPFMVLEHLEGKTLAEILNLGTLSPSRAQDIFEQVCQGLTYAHERGVIHRDIKPSNLMILKEDSEGNEIVKILDFGTFRRDDVSVQQQLTQQGSLIGTPNYMSPEQCRGEKADARSDIYALGCVMYEALCGAPPMVAESDYAIMNNHLTTAITKVKSKDPISQNFEAVLVKCMQKNPEERFSSAAELLQALEAVSRPEGSFRVPKNAIVLLVAVFLVLAAVFLVKQGIKYMQDESRKQTGNVVNKKPPLQGLPLAKLSLISPPTNAADLKHNLQLAYDWLDQNHSYLMHHYSKDIFSPDDAPNQIIEGYKLMSSYRRVLKEPHFGEDLQKKIEDETRKKISLLKKSSVSDGHFLRKERRNIYHYYKILLAIALLDSQSDKAAEILADAEATERTAEAHNEFLANSYQLMIEHYLSLNKIDAAELVGRKLSKLVARVSDNGLTKFKADLSLSKIAFAKKDLPEARRLSEGIVKNLFAQRSMNIEIFADSLENLSLVAFNLNTLGLYKSTIDLLSPPALWRGKPPTSSGWLNSKFLLAQAYSREGKNSEAKKIYSQIIPIAKANNESGPFILTLIAAEQMGNSVLHDDDAALKKNLHDGWRLVSLAHIDDLGNGLKLVFGDKPEDYPKYKRFIDASSKLEDNDKDVSLAMGVYFATKAHDLRGHSRHQEAIALYEDAIKEFARAQPYYHGAIICYYGEALVYLNSGQLDKVDAVLKRAAIPDSLRKEPNAEHYCLEHARIEVLLRQGKHQQARKEAKRVLAELQALINDDRRVGKPVEWKVTHFIGRTTSLLQSYENEPISPAFMAELAQVMRSAEANMDFVGPPVDNVEYFIAKSNFYAMCAIHFRRAGQIEKAIALFRKAYDTLPDRVEYKSMRENLEKELGLRK